MDINSLKIDSEYDPPNRFASNIGFNDRTIFITGGTGFMGKVLIEKLLRTCPKIKKFYAMVRPKKGKTPQERLDQIFAGPLYDLLKKTHGEDILKKVVAIEGDCELLDLGLSEEDRQILIEETEFVIHMAATVRFDEPLKKTVLLNTRGTKLVLELAKQMKKLMLFVHTSTAYCHLEEKTLYEKAYPPPADPHKIINLMETLDDEAVHLITKQIIGKSPNTYVFSKALAETLAANEIDNIPLIIIRPSLVVPVWKDPLPGWSDSFNGAVGLFVAGGRGILRTIYCQPDGYADFLPVDISANAIIAIMSNFLLYSKKPFYNLITTSLVKITWNELFQLAKNIAETKLPLNWVVWYPTASITTSRFLNKLYIVLFHYVPAVLVDALLILTLHKPILWKIQCRLTKGLEVFDYFINNQWEFNNEESLAATERLNETERRIYKLDDEGFDYKEYIFNAIHGCRLYLLNESDEDIPTARRRLKVMWAVDKVAKLFLTVVFLYFFLKYIIGPIFGTTIFN